MPRHSCQSEPVQYSLWWCVDLFSLSLVPGWSPQGDLPYRQPRSILWTGWHTTGVSSPFCSDVMTYISYYFFLYFENVTPDHILVLQLSINCFICASVNLSLSLPPSHMFYVRKKTKLFYFNIMKCANPMVLLEFQCPTTQVVPLSWPPCLPLTLLSLCSIH